MALTDTTYSPARQLLHKNCQTCFSRVKAESRKLEWLAGQDGPVPGSSVVLSAESSLTAPMQKGIICFQNHQFAADRSKQKITMKCSIAPAEFVGSQESLLIFTNHFFSRW